MMIIGTHGMVYRGSGLRDLTPGRGRPSKYHFGKMNEDGSIETICRLKFDTAWSKRTVWEVGAFDMCAKCMAGVVVIDGREGAMMEGEERDVNRMLTDQGDGSYDPKEIEREALEEIRGEIDREGEYAMELEYEFGEKGGDGDG